MAGGYHECEVSRGDVSRAVDDVRYALERRIDDTERELSRLKDEVRKLSALVGRVTSKVNVDEDW